MCHMNLLNERQIKNSVFFVGYKFDFMEFYIGFLYLILCQLIRFVPEIQNEYQDFRPE